MFSSFGKRILLVFLYHGDQTPRCIAFHTSLPNNYTPITIVLLTITFLLQIIFKKFD